VNTNYDSILLGSSAMEIFDIGKAATVRSIDLITRLRDMCTGSHGWGNCGQALRGLVYSLARLPVAPCQLPRCACACPSLCKSFFTPCLLGVTLHGLSNCLNIDAADPRSRDCGGQP
jgi:hypothetical protein